MNSPIILFRKDRLTKEELSIASGYFSVTESRINVQDKLVIGRYSVLPYYHELERDLSLQKSILINSYQQHLYIADFEYYEDIKEFTPITYFDLRDVPDKGPFVVKGKTNSKKNQWDKMMFAENKRQAVQIACDLKLDSMLQQQDIIVREYVPLKTLEKGISGLPFTNEWRFFVLYGRIVSYGFYWQDLTEKGGTINEDALHLVERVIERVKDKVNFVVIDVAQKENGDWIVIELNDGQCSGLSGNSAEVLYKNMADIIKK